MATIVRFQLRRDSAVNWANTNPILTLGEPGVETDTLKMKIGDGVTGWNGLGYTTTTVFNELQSTPTTLNGYGITDAATAAQGSLADSAVQPNDPVSDLNNDAGYYSAGSAMTGSLTGNVTGQVSDISNHSTTDLSEGTNLYYTDARSRAAVSAVGDLSYDSGTGVFSIQSFDSSFAAKTTTDLSEGTNLYYTDARSRAAVSAGSDLTYDPGTGVFSVTTYKSTDFDTDFSGKNTDQLAEGVGNLYYTDARVDAHLVGASGVSVDSGIISIGQPVGVTDAVAFRSITGDVIGSVFGDDSSVIIDSVNNKLFGDVTGDVTGSVFGDNGVVIVDSVNNTITGDLTGNVTGQVSDISNFTTDDLPEGVNVYLTDARLDEKLSGGSVTNIVVTGYIAGPAAFVIDPAAVGDNTGTVIIAGDLQVDGVTTTVNSTTVEVGDKNIVLGSNATADTQNDGAGITVSRPESVDAGISWNEVNDQWTVTNGLSVTGVTNVDSLVATTADIQGGTVTGAAISGGSVVGITDLSIEDGGTGASTADAARTNLDVDRAGKALALAIALG